MNRRYGIIIVLLLAAWVARLRLGAPERAEDAASLSLFPVTLGSWNGQESPLEPDVVKVAAVDDYLNRSYRSGNVAVGLYVGYYKSQRQGEALHSPMQCLPGAGWEPMKTESIDIEITPNSAARAINKLVVQKGIDQMLVLYWYQTLNRITASEYSRKLFLITDAFRSGRTDVALVRIIAPIDSRDPDGEARALTLARPFAARVLPAVQQQLFGS
jgi:EpsI family protein